MPWNKCTILYNDTNLFRRFGIMKRYIVLMLAAIMILTASACSKDTKESGDKGASGVVSKSNSDFIPAIETDSSVEFTKPAEKEKLDLSKDDISTDTMWFTYNDNGTIDGCGYIDEAGDELHISYIYRDDGVELMSFNGSLLVSDKMYKFDGEFSVDIGFTVHDGYYFYGYNFKD